MDVQHYGKYASNLGSLNPLKQVKSFGRLTLDWVRQVLLTSCLNPLKQVKSFGLLMQAGHGGGHGLS